MATVPIRISGHAAAAIDELATRLERPKQQIVDEALAHYQTELRMREAGRSIQRLRENPRKWKAYQREVASILSLTARPGDEI